MSKQDSSPHCVKCRSWEDRVKSVTDHWCRSVVSKRWFHLYGGFVEIEVVPLVRDFGNWVGYPMGNHRLGDNDDNDEKKEDVTGITASVIVSNDGDHLYTSSVDGYITDWDLKQGKRLKQWSAHGESAVTCLAGHWCWLASGGKDNSVMVWNRHDHDLVIVFEGHSAEVNSVSFNHTGTLLASASSDESVRVWSLLTGECFRVLLARKAVIQTRFVSDSNCVISVCAQRGVRLWSPTVGGFSMDEWSVDHSDVGVTDKDEDSSKVSFNCDHSIMAYIVNPDLVSGVCYMYEFPDQMDEVYYQLTGVCSICFHPYHPHILAAQMRNDYQIEILDVYRKEKIQSINGLVAPAKCFRFTPDLTRIIWLSERDNCVRLFTIPYHLHSSLL